MQLNLFPFAVLWVILAAAVLGLIVYRLIVAKHEDDTIHVMDSEAGIVSRQQAMALKLELIDRWGKTMTVIALVYGLAIFAGFVYQALTAPQP